MLGSKEKYNKQDYDPLNPDQFSRTTFEYSILRPP